MGNVIIDDFKIPNSCSECKLYTDSLSCSINGLPFFSNKRYEQRMIGCPLHSWISVTEALPQENKTVLVFSGKAIYAAQLRRGTWWKMDNQNHPCKPKYWMKLPDFPEEYKNKK